jgi:hypothetical protein
MHGSAYCEILTIVCSTNGMDAAYPIAAQIQKNCAGFWKS